MQKMHIGNFAEGDASVVYYTYMNVFSCLLKGLLKSFTDIKLLVWSCQIDI